MKEKAYEKRDKAVMELSDDLLDKVGGGYDDYDRCEWSPNGSHEWVLTDNGIMKCEYCGIYMG